MLDTAKNKSNVNAKSANNVASRASSTSLLRPSLSSTSTGPSRVESGRNSAFKQVKMMQKNHHRQDQRRRPRRPHPLSHKKHLVLAIAAVVWSLFSVVTLLLSSSSSSSSSSPAQEHETSSYNSLLELQSSLWQPSRTGTSFHQQRQHKRRREHDHEAHRPENADVTIPAALWDGANETLATLQYESPPFGFVMKELAQRVLSRHVANSNVLVIAPDAQQAAQSGDYDSIANAANRNSSQTFSLGGTMLLHAKSQGHAIHAMDAGMHMTKTNKAGRRTNSGKGLYNRYTPWDTPLDTWWSGFDNQTIDPKLSQQPRRPYWILLAVVDPGFQWEDVVWRDSQRLLKESTITYIVTAVRSRLVVKDDTGNDNTAGNDKSSIEMYGIEGVNALLERGYKMQVLQLSHYDTRIGGIEDSSTVFEYYGPNALLQSESDVKSLLSWGAETARKFSASTSSSRNSNIYNTNSPVFTTYLFGTQGLDLAIPSRRLYIHDDSRLVGDESWTQINLYKPVKFHSCQRRRRRNADDLRVDISFENDKLNFNSNKNIHVTIQPESDDKDIRNESFLSNLSPLAQRLRNRSSLVRKLQNAWRDVRHFAVNSFRQSTHRSRVTKAGVQITSSVSGALMSKPNDNRVESKGMGETHFVGKDDTSSLQVWYSHEDPRQSEATCARYKDAVTCKTRILRKKENRPRMRSYDGHKLRPNRHSEEPSDNLDLLLIMLDPMSRGHFHRSMPQTKALLEDLGFLHFSQYSAVGDNSGPNQAALYSGKPLADRDGIANDGKSEWLWDSLRKYSGYVTLKGEDGCIENSNMLQSLQPKVTHGEALNQMFCFDFNRPNCLGSEPAASHLLRYGMQFIDTYGAIDDASAAAASNDRQPWAAFLHFVDSHEDTMTLSTILDSLLASFLKEAFERGKLSNAMVVIISDHGLHYGPYFQTLSGRRERTEPLLYIHTPPKIRESSQGRAMAANAHLWTTPFDVHQTMIDLTIGGYTNDGKRESLLSPLPDSRKSCRGVATIPERFCDLHDVFADRLNRLGEDSCPRTPQPPSILSFYADIPKSNRPNLLKRNCSNTYDVAFDFEKDCICGTSHRDIYPCEQHPWGPAGANSTEKEEEYFAVVKCPNRVERFDSRVMRRQAIIDRYHNRTSDSLATTSKDETRPKRSPDILVLEVDSVSKAYAERHLPLTIQFLRKHQIREDANGRHQCANGVCSLDFQRFAVVGANSVANQVASLSGCVVSRFHQSCFDRKYRTDSCSENGLFGTEEGCEACPVGTFPIDPLIPCNSTKESPEKCCTDMFQGYNSSRICRDIEMFEHNLQLFRRGPRRHTVWCPTNNDVPPTSSPWLFDVARSKGYITYFAEEFCYDFSPYVTQDNTFPLHTDFELRKVYCRLQSCLENCEGPWPPMGPHICLEKEGENPAFTQIEDIWDAYPDVPKFAFLNGIAAHDYDFEWIKMIASLEAYDIQLASFLERIVASPDFAKTIIVIRTDHGLQGGPTTVDYSVQVEHRDPWTQVILPQNLVSTDSLSVLFTNQERLATGYDLYHSFRNLMSAAGSTVAPFLPMPNWTVDLFQSEISRERTCRDAKIPEDFCPCEGGTGPDRAPSYGVCNVYEPYNDLFCASDNDPPILPKNPE